MPPAFNPGRTTTAYFLQNALTFVLGRRVGIDGEFGNESRGALAAALGDLGIGGSINNLNVYQQFLGAVASKGFRPESAHDAAAAAPATRAESEQSRLVNAAPEELLLNVYQVIEQELGCTSIKPKIEGAVTAFANHPEVQKLFAVSEADEEGPATSDEPEETEGP